MGGGRGRGEGVGATTWAPLSIVQNQHEPPKTHGLGTPGRPYLQVSALVTGLCRRYDEEVGSVFVRQPRAEHRIEGRRRLLREGWLGSAAKHTS